MTNDSLIGLLERCRRCLDSSAHYQHVDEDIDFALSALKSGDVVLVPREPTEQMVDAAFNATVWPDLNRATTAEVIIGLRSNMKKEYRAMLDSRGK